MYCWLLILIGYLPFQIALNILPNVDLASSRFFIVLFCLIWFILFVFGFPSLRKKRLGSIQFISLAIFLVLASISLIWAENFFWGLRKVVYFLSIFPLYFLVINIVSSYRPESVGQIKKIVWLLAGGGFLAALIGIFQFLGSFVFGLEEVYRFWATNIVPVFSGFNYGSLLLAYPSWLVNVEGATIMRAFSIFSDPHIFSFYLGLILPLAAAMVAIRADQDEFKKPLAKLIILLVLFIALFLSFSRGAYMAIIASFLTMSFLLFYYLKNKKMPLVLCFFLLIFIIPGTPIANRFYSSFDLSEKSNAGRLDMWQQAGQAGWQNPFFGLGLGNYSLSVDKNYDYRNPVTAHNLYLDFFSEIGLLALLIWLFLVLGTIWQLFSKLQRTDRVNQHLIVGLIGSLVYFSVHSIFETAVYSPVVLGVLMVILGIATILINEGDENSNVCFPS